MSGKRRTLKFGDRMMFGSMNAMTVPGPGGLALKTEAGWPPHPAAAVMHPTHPMVAAGQDHLAAAAAASAAAAVGQNR